MARSSPSTQRVVAILNLFADHPGESFSLTDIIRALKLNRSTCHSLVHELVDAGYLYRTMDKLYVLGPAAARLGEAASEGSSPLEVAQVEMRRLADRYDVVCSAVFREGNEAVYRGQAVSMSHLGWTPRRKRVPFVPPFAAIYFAWDEQSQVEEWLDALSPAPSSEDWKSFYREMEFAREHGFVTLLRLTAPDVDVNLAAFMMEPSEKRPIAFIDQVEAGASYQLASVTAPIFDERGRVAFTLTLTGFNSARSGEELLAIGADVRSACERITNYIGGNLPDDWPRN